MRFGNPVRNKPKRDRLRFELTFPWFRLMKIMRIRRPGTTVERSIRKTNAGKNAQQQTTLPVLKLTSSQMLYLFFRRVLAIRGFGLFVWILCTYITAISRCHPSCRPLLLVRVIRILIYASVDQSINIAVWRGGFRGRWHSFENASSFSKVNPLNAIAFYHAFRMWCTFDFSMFQSEVWIGTLDVQILCYNTFNKRTNSKTNKFTLATPHREQICTFHFIDSNVYSNMTSSRVGLAVSIYTYV